MHDFFAWLATLPQNSMFAGLTGATVIGGVMVMLRQLPMRFFRWALLGVSAQVTVKSEDPVFWWIVHWLSQSPYGQVARRMRLESRSAHVGNDASSSVGGEAPEQQFVLSPADGLHWFFMGGALLLISRGKESGGSSGMNFRAREEINVRAFTWRPRQYIQRLIDEAREALRPSATVTRVTTNYYGHWTEPMEVTRRPIETVILREGVAERLLDDASWFLSARDWYMDRAIPWRRGLARCPIERDFLKEKYSDRGGICFNTKECILTLPQHAAFVQRKSSSDSEQLSFSGVLNAIDGLAAAEGRVLVMTTNHIEKIDPALRRPGRADLELFIDVADASQARRMFQRFWPGRDGAGAFAERTAGQSPAAIQGLLMAMHYSQEN